MEKRAGLILMVLALVMNGNYAQTLLDADGVSDTYELINSVLAPGYNVIEAPGTTVGECDNHSAFGDHITQVFDDSLDLFVFAFHIHVDEDNDRCKNFDRQRCEIKTYDQSPDSLLGVLGETHEYKWKFKLDEGFQASSSFTHIHQLKSVGSPEDGMPLITLTPRKGTPDKLQLRYAAYTDQSTIYEVALDPFKGVWVEATERVRYGEAGIGSYALSIETVHDGTNLMTYSTGSLRMWKTDADFIRPKWGIYRSLNDAASLRDEIVYFANFSIYEEDDLIAPSVNQKLQNRDFSIFPNPVSNRLNIKMGQGVQGAEVSMIDQSGRVIYHNSYSGFDISIDVSGFNEGVYTLKLKTTTRVNYTNIIIR